jgi:hypothetical protein
MQFSTQFRISELLILTTCAAVAAWLVSPGLAWLVPILAGVLLSYSRGKRSGFKFVLAVFGGAAFGVGLLITIWLVRLTVFHPFRGALAPFASVELPLTILAGLVTLILFFQFRKLVRVSVKSQADT